MIVLPLCRYFQPAYHSLLLALVTLAKPINDMGKLETLTELGSVQPT